jgi:hypothetical protein
MRGEHMLEGFHELLQQVKPISDLGGLWRPLASPLDRGFGPIAGHNRIPWRRSEPLGQGVCRPIGPHGDRLPAFQIEQHRAIGLACAEREVVNASDRWSAVAWEQQAMDHAQEGQAADREAQASAQAGAHRPAPDRWRSTPPPIAASAEPTAPPRQGAVP